MPSQLFGAGGAKGRRFVSLRSTAGTPGGKGQWNVSGMKIMGDDGRESQVAKDGLIINST